MKTAARPAPPPPRPQRDSGIGFHYFPDELHYRAVDLQSWLPELESAGASWLTLRASVARAIPEAFLTGLIENNIEPIVHMPLSPSARVAPDGVALLLRQYARCGARYVVLGDRPNNRSTWPRNAFDRSLLIDRFLDIWLPLAELGMEAGLRPIFPPLEQGGDFWDTAFLAGALERLQRRGKGDLLQELIVGCYAFAGTHDPQYGAGGAEAWPDSKPYRTPAGSQDQLGFRSFEWYAATVQRALGAERPLLMLAGGARLGDGDLATDDLVDEEWHADCNAEIADKMQRGELDANLLNVNFWLLSAAPGDAGALQSWFRMGQAPVRAVARLREIAARRAPAASDENNAPPTKLLAHYLLLPRIDGSASAWHWNLVGDFMRTHQPTCGYAVEEARRADLVTLVGGEDLLGPEIEVRLRQAGCRVERLAATDPQAATVELLKTTTAQLSP